MEALWSNLAGMRGVKQAGQAGLCRAEQEEEEAGASQRSGGQGQPRPPLARAGVLALDW